MFDFKRLFAKQKWVFRQNQIIDFVARLELEQI